MRVLIADDEPLALRRLSALLSEHQDIKIVERCADGAETIEAIKELKPDAVFLDVVMPGADGFEVVSAFLGRDAPEIVFVTAFQEYALRAFDSRAIDFLLKPLGRERLAETIDRLRDRVSDKHANERNEALETTISELRNARGDGALDARRRDLWIRHQGRSVRVPQRDIEWIEADRDYIKFHVDGRVLMLRETMQAVEERLDPDTFLRVHRSAIVNVDKIQRSNTVRAGFRVLILESGEELRVGRTFKPDVTKRLALNRRAMQRAGD